MQILYFNELESTQTKLKELIRTNELQPPVAVVCDIQNAGIGSRGNSWQGLRGNLFLSFAIPLKTLPNDLKIESASIYFSYLLKEVLSEHESKVWMKWPNDFYRDDKKIGGMITNVLKDHLVCGVGLNMLHAPEGFDVLDIEISREKLLKAYFIKLEKMISWKQVFSNYELEFRKNQNFTTHVNSLRISLENAELQSDGSIVINGERLYSLR